MKAHPRGVLAGIAAIAVTAIAITLLAGGGGSRKQLGIDPHPNLHLSAATMHRLLNATAAASTSTPQAELAAQGRELFRSNTLSKTGSSCQSCHTEAATNFALGAIIHPKAPGDFTGPRKPSPLWDIARTAPYGWTGAFPTLEAFVIPVIKSFFKVGATQPDATTGAQVAALVAYMKTLHAPRTSFDEGTLSAAAQRGLRVFQTKGRCISCHSGPQFTDNRVHNTNVPQAPGANDPGSPLPGGGFDTPQLRDLAATGPYMHNGVIKTLADVVTFYDTQSSIAPLHLTQAEKDDLVAFMQSL